MPSPFLEELAKSDATLAAARGAEIDGLKVAVQEASQQSLIAIGSGGSFTVSTFLSTFHEALTGRVSRAATPLELICNPTIASTSPIFIVSAEGKNPDILEALRRARLSGSRTIHVITNRDESPLIHEIERLSDVSAHVFALTDKDGYLATNSLLMDASLVARVYGELDGEADIIPRDTTGFAVGDQSLSDWLAELPDFAAEAARRKGLLVLFSPQLRPIAIDLESKLSESALAFCQLADFRSFAHGRHLWLTQREKECSLLVLTEPRVRGLWEDMRDMVPLGLPILEMGLASASPKDLIAGLAAQMHLVGAIADAQSRDIARPHVGPLGRQLHYADLSSLIPAHRPDPNLRGEVSKYEALGSFWPARRARGNVRRSLVAYEKTLSERRFRAIVFDYDGTICSSTRRNLPPSQEILAHLARILRAGIKVGVASGRGSTVRRHLLDHLPPELHADVHLGLYNGGWVAPLADEIALSGETPELLLHCKRLMEGLRDIGVPVEVAKVSAPYQVSVRFAQGVSTESIWYVVEDALRQAGLPGVSVVRSKHSIDILGKGVSKSNLVSEIVRVFKIDPYQILTVGDLGAWPGNDYSLLEHRYSLSVDLPSRRLDRGWKLAPHHARDVDATLWYLDRMILDQPGYVRFKFAQ